MTTPDREEALAWTRKLLPPPGIMTRVNGESIARRPPVATLRARLQTETSNAAGFLRRAERTTEVTLYEPLPGEPAMLYEMGIPIVETGDKWHCDVAQKIPLTLDREGVAPSFIRDLRLAVFNRMHEQVKAEEVNSPWHRTGCGGERLRSGCRQDLPGPAFLGQTSRLRSLGPGIKQIGRLQGLYRGHRLDDEFGGLEELQARPGHPAGRPGHSVTQAL